MPTSEVQIKHETSIRWAILLEWTILFAMCKSLRETPKLKICIKHIFALQATVIVKLLARGPSNAKAAEQEIESLRLCARHPHMIHMHEVSSRRESTSNDWVFTIAGSCCKWTCFLDIVVLVTRFVISRWTRLISWLSVGNPSIGSR